MAAASDTSSDLAFYRQGMRVDPTDLVRECSDQAMSHAKIARQAVLAASRLSAMDLQVSRDFGRRARVAREHLANEHTGRITDIMVKAEIDQDLRAAVLPEERAALKQVCGEWEALREASKDRGFMISKLVDLWIAGLLTSDTPKMSTRGQRAQTFRDTNGAPPPPTPTSDKAWDSQEYRDAAEARAAMTAARHENEAVLPQPTRADKPKPTTRKRETLDI